MKFTIASILLPAVALAQQAVFNGDAEFDGFTGCLGASRVVSDDGLTVTVTLPNLNATTSVPGQNSVGCFLRLGVTLPSPQEQRCTSITFSNTHLGTEAWTGTGFGNFARSYNVPPTQGGLRNLNRRFPTVPPTSTWTQTDVFTVTANSAVQPTVSLEADLRVEVQTNDGGAASSGTLTDNTYIVSIASQSGVANC